MSTNVKLSIKSSNYYDDKKTVTDTINYVNPNLDNSKALELAQRLNALTLNSYRSTNKIETTELDSIIPKGARTLNIVYITKGGQGLQLDTSNPTITFTNQTAYIVNNQTIINLRITTPYDGTAPVIQNLQNTASTTWQLSSIQYGFQGSGSTLLRNLWNITIISDEFTADTVTFTIHFDETATTAAYDLPITVIFTEG